MLLLLGGGGDPTHLLPKVNGVRRAHSGAERIFFFEPTEYLCPR